MKTNYIILGAGGFTGKALIRELAGKNVFAVTRDTDRSLLAASLAGGHNLVADLSYSSVSGVRVTNPGTDFSDNINLLIDNLNFAREIGAARFIYTSTGGAIYGMTGEEHIPETHGTDPISHYGIVKLASEKYVRMFCSLHQMDFLIVRPSNLYGPGQIPFRGQGIIATILASAIRRSPITIFGKGDNVRDYIFVDDFCRWLSALFTKGQPGETYNAGSGQGYSIMELIRMIRRVLPAPENELTLQYMPDRPFDVKRNVLNRDKIAGHTGLDAHTGLQQGIGLTAEWIRDYMEKEAVELSVI